MQKRRVKGTGRVYKRGGLWWIRYIREGKRYDESSGSRHQYDAAALLRKRLENPVDRKPTLNEVLDRLLFMIRLRLSVLWSLIASCDQALKATAHRLEITQAGANRPLQGRQCVEQAVVRCPAA